MLRDYLDKIKTKFAKQSLTNDSGTKNAGAASVFSGVNNYLNGTVRLKFLHHPAIRWGLLAVAVLYLLVGVIVGWKVYKVKAESVNVRRILSIYPLPAVLMPQDLILVKDYLNQLRYIRHFADKTKQALPADNELRAQLINQLVETRLLLRTINRYGVRVTKADIDSAYQKIAEENGGAPELKKLLTDLYGMSEKEFRVLLRDQLLREKVRKDVLAQVQAKHILIKDESKAKDVLEQVKKEPGKFDELAKQHTEDTSTKDKNGDLGFFGRGVMSQAFEDAVFKLKKDEVTPEIVKTEFGFHIIKLVDRKGKIDKSYKNFISELQNPKKIWVVLK